MNKKINKIVLTALFAAFACVATMIIKFPTGGTNGYVNIGDSVVLLAAWLIGGPYGAIAAGLGPALADLVSGYPSYVPGTFVIKFLMGLVAWMLFKILSKFNPTIAYVTSAIVAEIVMVLGYFFYESAFLGYGMGAAASIPSNMIQGVTCIAIGIMAILALNVTKAVGVMKKMI